MLLVFKPLAAPRWPDTRPSTRVCHTYASESRHIVSVCTGRDSFVVGAELSSLCLVQGPLIHTIRKALSFARSIGRNHQGNVLPNLNRLTEQSVKARSPRTQSLTNINQRSGATANKGVVTFGFGWPSPSRLRKSFHI